MLAAVALIAPLAGLTLVVTPVQVTEPASTLAPSRLPIRVALQAYMNRNACRGDTDT